MSRKHIFDLVEEYHLAVEELEQYLQENDTDEVPEEIHDRLVINQDEVDRKLESYFYYIKELEGEILVLKEEIDSFKMKIKKRQSTIDKIKSYMVEGVKAFGKQNKKGNYSYKNTKFSASAIKSRPVIIEDENIIPSEFKKFTFASKDLTKDDLVLLKAYLEENPVLYDRLKSKLDIKASVLKREVKSALDNGEEVLGASVDEESIYIKII